MLREKGVFVTHQLVGGGNANRLETIARNEGVLDSVFFLGLKSRDEVLEWMRGLDIYIQPSRSEGLPRSIIEAMANAVPCIASDVGGIPELLPRKFLFHHNGSEAAQIVNMITDINDNQLNDMAQTNFERSKEYKPELLDSRRFDFFSKAISTVRQNKLGENI